MASNIIYCYRQIEIAISIICIKTGKRIQKTAVLADAIGRFARRFNIGVVYTNGYFRVSRFN